MSNVQRASQKRPNSDGPEGGWASGDPLGEALHLLRLEGVVYCQSELSSPWGIEMPAMDGCLMFHIVTSGRCWVRVDEEEPLELLPGAFSLMPHGEGHALMSGKKEQTTPLFDLPLSQVCERFEILQWGGGGDSTRLICGAVRFDHPSATHLLKHLPKMIHVDSWEDSQAEWVQSTLRLMASEAVAQKPGGETVVTRLADILVIQGIRSWITRDSTEKVGWLAALRDERIGRAILAMHRSPERAWTVETLAMESSMSRSSFAARFQGLLNESPMQYLLGWRMHCAASALRRTEDPMIEIATRFGYQSEAAFGRAFKRALGVSPGSVRRERQGVGVH